MSLDPLLRGLFDYAGMFPPAALSFDDALAKSARFPTSLRRPLLVGNDLVVTPAEWGRLDPGELEAAGYRDRPLRVCLVGVPLSDAVAQAQAIVAFNESRRSDSPPIQITTLEVHADALDGAPEALREARAVLGSVDLYFEPKWDDARMAEGLDEVIGMLHGLRSDGRPIGFKARCEGPTQLSAPTLAHALAAVARGRIPLKLTQGLHHPFAGDARHGNRHGFLNVLFALRLHQAIGMGLDEMQRCVEDVEPAHFAWDQGLAWDGHTALMQRIEEAASHVPFAIGSCSLDEPDADLLEIAN